MLQLLLLHLQRHELLALQVRHVVDGGGGGGGRSARWCQAALWRGDAAVGLVPPLVLLVVECGEGEDVQEEQRRADGDCDAQLGGVVPLGLDHHGRLVCQVAALALVGGLLGVGGRDPRVACGGGPVILTGEALGVRVWRGVLWRDLGGGGHVLEELVDIVEMRDQLQPEGHLGGAVVVSHPGLEADVEVKLVLGVVFGPGHLLEAVGFGVDELCVLGNRLVWISARGTPRRNYQGCGSN